MDDQLPQIIAFVSRGATLESRSLSSCATARCTLTVSSCQVGTADWPTAKRDYGHATRAKKSTLRSTNLSDWDSKSSRMSRHDFIAGRNFISDYNTVTRWLLAVFCQISSYTTQCLNNENSHQLSLNRIHIVPDFRPHINNCVKT